MPAKQHKTQILKTPTEKWRNWKSFPNAANAIPKNAKKQTWKTCCKSTVKKLFRKRIPYWQSWCKFWFLSFYKIQWSRKNSHNGSNSRRSLFESNRKNTFQMRVFLTHIKWQFLLLAKNNIITISFIVTFFYGLIFYFFKDIEAVDKILTLLILNDPAIIGLIFIGIIIILKRLDFVLE